MTTRDDDRSAPLSRRQLVATLVGGAAALLAAPLVNAAAAMEGAAPLPPMTVYKSPTCGCCGDWIKIAQQAGFRTTIKDSPDVTPLKRMMRIPENLWSCHTVVVGGYTLEGHVPLDLVKKLLAEKPKAAGIAVPGMPVGSPGMSVPGMKADRYDVILFRADGRTSVYARR